MESGELQQETPFIPPVQTKLNIGKPGDVYEVEADKTADAVVSQTNTTDSIQKMGTEEEEVQANPLAGGLTSFVQKQQAAEEEPVQTMAEKEEEPVQAKEEEEDVQAKCDDCSKEDKVQKMEDEKEEPVQTKGEKSSGNSNGLSAQLNAAKGSGSPMTKFTKSEMEMAFGNDFSEVNIHTDDKAKAMSKKLNAQAFTHGNDIYFNDGKYNPNTKEGKYLLAHELTHTIQQKGKSLGIRKKENEPEPMTPVQLIENYTNFGGLNLQEIELASDLRSRVLNHAQFNFAIETLVTLDESNMHQVSYSMVLHMDVGDILSLANTSKGYDFLTNVLQTLKDESQIRKINKWLPSEDELRNIKTEEERLEQTEELKQSNPKAKEGSFFPENPVDPTEISLKITGTSRGEQDDHISFGITDLPDIEKHLDSYSKKNNDLNDFIAVLHFMGHGVAKGDERKFYFGDHYYPLELVKTYRDGIYEKFVLDGGTVIMEGCEVAKGERGKEFLGEIARITFGEKNGYIKGNQCEAKAAAGGVNDCDPVTYKWPSDFK